MNRRNNIIIVCGGAVFLAALLLFFMKERSVEPLDTTGKINVVVSVYPLAYFVKTVGGDYVSVNTLTPIGTEAHDFEPSPRDLVSLGTADIFFYNGAHYEPWIDKWNKNGFVRPRVVVDMSSALIEKGERLLDSGKSVDPHFWLDPEIAMQEIDIIRDALIRIDPLSINTYQENATRAKSALQGLHARFTQDLASCVRRDMIVSHNAFNYFAKRYNLNAIAIAGISPDEEPSPRTIASIVEQARDRGIRYVFFETMVSSLLAETVAREIGGGILVLNPIENITREEVARGDDYVSLMESNLRNLQVALECKKNEY